MNTEGVLRPRECLSEKPQGQPAPEGIITLHGTGVGPTSPEAVGGQSIDSPLGLAGNISAPIANVVACVALTRLVAPGLFPLTVIAPSVASGCVPMALQVGGAKSQEPPLLTVTQ